MKFLSVLAFLIFLAASGKAQYRKGLDTTFGARGLYIDNFYPVIPSGDDDRITDALFEPNGKILAIAGSGVVRLQASGIPDSSFGKYGCVVDTFFAADGSVYEVKPVRLALQKDGALIVASVINADVWPAYVPQTLISRISADGRIDRSFGARGSYTHAGLKGMTPHDVKVWDGGRIVVSGDTAYVPFLAVFESTGAADNTFGSAGKVVDHGSVAVGNARIAIDKQGRIVQLRQHYELARYLANGIPDTSFNHTGTMQAVEVPHTFTAMPTSKVLAIDDNGAIWVAGNSYYTSVEPFSLTRIDSTGTVDLGFGSGGYAEYPWFTGKMNLLADMALLREGRLLLAGTVQNPTTGQDNFGLMRVMPDGRLDTSFGEKGRLITELEGYSVSPDRLYRVLEQLDRKILAFGTACKGLPHISAAIARYNQNGRTSFPEFSATSFALRIFPNPAGSTLEIASETSVPRGSNLSVSTISGACVLRTAFSGVSGARLDLSQLSSGTYFLILTDAQQQVLFKGKFLKN